MNHARLALVFLTPILVIVVLFQAPSRSPGGKTREDRRARAMESYGKLPLHFEANVGQADEQVRFLARGQGYAMFFTATEAVLALREKEGSRNSRLPARPAGGPVGGQAKNENRKTGKTTAAPVRMRLAGANPDVQVSGQNELPGKSNYFIGNDPKKWRTNVPHYAKVRYADVYPGIDLVYHGNSEAAGQLEYDFLIAPGTDSKAITMNFAGAPLRIASNGDVVITTEGMELRQRRPRIYQETTDGARREIGGGYVLRGKNEVGFEVGAYDASLPLIIDPVLVYSTYLGGSGNDQASGVAIAAAGSIFVSGSTDSTNFPIASPLQGSFGGGTLDFFVARLDPTGTSLVYSTYIGGNNRDVSRGMVVDSGGNAYLWGDISSTNFPVVNGFQTTFGGALDDCGLVKLNPTGSAILYSTYLGGAGGEDCVGGSLEPGNIVILTGGTQSANFPITSGALQPTLGGSGDVFITRIDTSATGSASLLYSTFLGGNGLDVGHSVIRLLLGEIIVTGQTRSTNFPTVNALQPALGGGQDVFVAKINATGTALLFSTYFGGSGDEPILEVAQSLAIDSATNIYVIGSTSSPNFPLLNPFQSTFGGGSSDAFLVKLNSTGTALMFSTYLGSSGQDAATGIVVNAANEAYVTGFTDSANFPTLNALQPVIGGGADCFLSHFSAAGTSLVESTFLGGNGSDEPFAIRLTGTDILLAGLTSSTNFPTVTPFQAALAGALDAFVARISPTPTVTADLALRKSGAPNPVNVGSNVTYTLNITNNGPSSASGVTVTDTLPAGVTFVSVPVAPGTCTQSISPPATTVINCTIGTLAASTSAQVQIVVQTTSVGTLVNSATVSSTSITDPNPTNNTATDTTNVVAAAVVVSPSALSFGNQNVGSTSTAQTVSYANSGTAAVSITSISTSGDFAQTNSCGTSVAAGGSCQANVTFRPTATGTRTGTLVFTDSAAGSPRTVALSGTGIGGPVAVVSPTSLTFGTQLVGTTSATQAVTLSNTGNVALTISSITISGDFAKTDNCGASVAAGGSCGINVTFGPSTLGTRNGVLTITDNAAGSPRTVSLTGTGTDFSIAAASGTPTSTTIPRGGTATFPITVTSPGGNQPVALNCNSAPPRGSCSVLPASVAPTASAPATATVSVTTAPCPCSLAPPATWRIGPWRFEMPTVLPMLLTLLLAAWLARQRKGITSVPLRGTGPELQASGCARFAVWRPLVLAGVLLVVLLTASCRQVDTGTPLGTYPITVTATAGGQSRAITFTVTVQ